MVAIKLGKLWQGVKYSLIAAKGAALYTTDEDRAKRYVRNALAEIPGLGAKASQLFADALGTPDEPAYNRSLPQKLGIEQVAQIIAEHNPSLQRQLATIDPQGYGASLSQVHRATLNSGQELAIKVQYPGLHDRLAEQLSLVVTTAKVTAPPKYQVALKDLSGYFLQSFQRELDYGAEATMQQKFATIAYASGLPIIVPRVYPDLSSQVVLCQSYEPSLTVGDACAGWDKTMRCQAADALGQFFLVCLLEHGLVHSDWHSGNFGFTSAGKVVIYDYGSVLTLTDAQQNAIHALLHSLSAGEPISPYDHFVALGFDGDKLSHIADRLPALCAKVFGPLLRRGRFQLKDWQLAQGIDDVLGADKWWFRSAGPAWFLQLMRSCFGLFQGIDKLGVGLSLNAEQHLGRIKAPAAVPDHSQNLAARPKPMAKHLRIVVVENGREKANITLPALAVDELEDLLPESAREATAIDLVSLRRSVQRSGYLPQELFNTQDDNKTITVTLTAA